MGLNFLFGALALSLFVSTTYSLQCYLCGQYNDGVGSITPCINDTHMQLKNCPLQEHSYCIKYYVSEGSVVRDCVVDCTEKESWGTRTFCCNEDACNASATLFAGLVTIFALVFLSLQLQ